MEEQEKEDVESNSNNLYNNYFESDFGHCKICGRPIPKSYSNGRKLRTTSLRQYNVCLKEDKEHINFYLDTDDDYAIYESLTSLKTLHRRARFRILAPLALILMLIAWVFFWVTVLYDWGDINNNNNQNSEFWPIVFMLVGGIVFILLIIRKIKQCPKAKAVLGPIYNSTIFRNSLLEPLKDRTLLIQNPLLKKYVFRHRAIIGTCNICERPIPEYYLYKRSGLLSNLHTYHVCLHGDTQHIRFYLDQKDKHLINQLYPILKSAKGNRLVYRILGFILIPFLIILTMFGIGAFIDVGDLWDVFGFSVLSLMVLLYLEWKILLQFWEIKGILGYFDAKSFKELKKQYKTNRNTFYIGSKQQTIHSQAIPAQLRMKRLTSLFEVSNNVKIADVAKILGLNRIELITTLLDNKESLPGFKIDQDNLIISNNKDLSQFMLVLDKEFQFWDENVNQNDGKMEMIPDSEQEKSGEMVSE